MATLDILPGCVSSVYFMYSNQWAWLQLGKVSLCGAHSMGVVELTLFPDQCVA
jgi:arginyl-tRNA--protein-N-Asp/Glu arginylyltransferase